jgi:hypothetical protein
MVDNGPPGAKNVCNNICIESPHQDGLYDTMEVMEEAEMVEFDSMEGGGFVAASPSHHRVTLTSTGAAAPASIVAMALVAY